MRYSLRWRLRVWTATCLATLAGAMVLPMTATMANAAGSQGPSDTALQSRGAVPQPLSDENGNGIADVLDDRLAGGDDGGTHEVKVFFGAPNAASRVQAAIGAFNLRHQYRFLNGIVADLTKEQIRALAKRPFVTRILPVGRVRPSMEAARMDTGVTSVRQQLSGFGKGAGVGVCVVDSGARTSHEMFDHQGKFGGFYNAITEQFTESSVQDAGDHGTMVAAIIAGDGDGGPYAAPLEGVAPDATLYIARVMNADILGNLSGSDADVEKAIEWCMAQTGVDIINLSLIADYASDGTDSMSLLVTKAVQMGKLVVAGAGNREIRYWMRVPAAAHLSVAVGGYAERSAMPDWVAAAVNSGDLSAIEAAQSQGFFFAHYTTRGPAYSGLVKPDVAAPGVSMGGEPAAAATAATESGTAHPSPAPSSPVSPH